MAVFHISKNLRYERGNRAMGSDDLFKKRRADRKQRRPWNNSLSVGRGVNEIFKLGKDWGKGENFNAL